MRNRYRLDGTHLKLRLAAAGERIVCVRVKWPKDADYADCELANDRVPAPDSGGTVTVWINSFAQGASVPESGYVYVTFHDGTSVPLRWTRAPTCRWQDLVVEDDIAAPTVDLGCREGRDTCPIAQTVVTRRKA